MQNSASATPGDRIGRGIVLTIAVFASFSTADAVVKGLTAHYSVVAIYFMTSLFAAVPIAVMVWRGKRPVVIRPRFPKLVAARTLLLVLDTIGAYVAFSRLPLANAYTLIFTGPLIVTALSPLLLRETVGWHRWSAVVVGFLGIVVVMRPGGAALDIGYLGALGSAAAFALALIITRQIGGRESDSAMLVWLIVAKIVLPGVVFAFMFVPIPPADIALMAFAGLFVGLAQIFIVLAFKQAPPAVIVPFQYTQMLWGVIYGFFIFGDVPDRFVIAGSGLVITSGLYILWREHVVHRRARAMIPPR